MARPEACVFGIAPITRHLCTEKPLLGERPAVPWPNPSIERTCPGKPAHAAHVER